MATSSVDATRRYINKMKATDPEKLRARRAANNKRYRETHREERARRSREWHHANKDKIKGKVLERKFGIGEAEYTALLIGQNGSCKICKKSCSSGRRLAVDHCHDSGRVRGLLCINCNNALGHAKDSPALLRAMAAYLENIL